MEPVESDMSDTQKSDKSAGDSDRLGPRREALLQGLIDADGRASAAQLRRETEVPAGSINHHLGVLESGGLVAETDERVDAGRGSASKVYRLTDDGEQRAAALDDGDDEPGTEELRERVSELEEKNGRLQEAVTALAVETGNVAKVKEELDNDD